MYEEEEQNRGKSEIANAKHEFKRMPENQVEKKKEKTKRKQGEKRKEVVVVEEEE
jgi:hypothetical protein